MLNDSTSPLNALQKLLDFRRLEQRQQVLKYLRDKATEADLQIKRSPLAVRVTLQGPDGPMQVLPDHGTANALHHQFIGNYQGLTELDRLLSQREAELRAIIALQNQQENT